MRESTELPFGRGGGSWISWGVRQVSWQAPSICNEILMLSPRCAQATYSSLRKKNSDTVLIPMRKWSFRLSHLALCDTHRQMCSWEQAWGGHRAGSASVQWPWSWGLRALCKDPTLLYFAKFSILLHFTACFLFSLSFRPPDPRLFPTNKVPALSSKPRVTRICSLSPNPPQTQIAEDSIVQSESQAHGRNIFGYCCTKFISSIINDYGVRGRELTPHVQCSSN